MRWGCGWRMWGRICLKRRCDSYQYLSVVLLTLFRSTSNYRGAFTDRKDTFKYRGWVKVLRVNTDVEETDNHLYFPITWGSSLLYVDDIYDIARRILGGFLYKRSIHVQHNISLCEISGLNKCHQQKQVSAFIHPFHFPSFTDLSVQREVMQVTRLFLCVVMPY